MASGRAEFREDVWIANGIPMETEVSGLAGAV